MDTAALDLRVRYFQDSTPAGVPCREESFIRREIPMVLPIDRTALVLVDVWNIHFIESWVERARQVTVDAIVPILNTAREVGLTIVHAPCPEVARQFPQLNRHAPPDPVKPADWPPVEFRRRAGEYAAYRGPRSQPPGIGIHWDEMAPHLGMSPAIEVQDEDYLIATGQQLHDLLEEQGILHLIYAGFATNWCILGRDYGIVAMSRRGYGIVLLREATMGVEFPDTLDTNFATELAIREVEQKYGFSVSNAGFFEACRTSLG